MSYIKWLISILICAVLTIFLSLGKVSAQRGCCSWHGGISHCAPNGRYVCNDGTYSPTCTCWVPTYNRTPPVPEIPKDTQSTWRYIKNINGGVDLHFDWNRPDGRSYSISLNKNAGANPGPLADTTKSEFVFENVSPGTWHINLKEMIDGQWSQIIYWTVEIPTNVEQIAQPLYSPTPIPTRSIYVNTQMNKTEEKNSIGLIEGLAIAVGIPSFIVFLGKANDD